uniref:3'-5' exonuclease domain-containing protein n=13 Tax=Cyatheaceae TaxID=29635 RepID=A0A7S9C176_9MONI|nr:hypothetical protein [Gymnosphaera sp. ZYZ-2020b]QPF69862.1 hypothetical protein [Gymnosphaera bonii]QPF69865.1 hypothetical protein [Gymnosphaera ramispina]QPF69866.1 hypothetical protein [Gymnosphaera saxicola]QPF69861.1 hypothetical protein [Gymnosphaera sp. ZYZ-2020b]
MQDLQCSNWEQRPLTVEQQLYAAADAHCLLVAYDVLETEASKGWETYRMGLPPYASGSCELCMRCCSTFNSFIITRLTTKLCIVAKQALFLC